MDIENYIRKELSEYRNDELPFSTYKKKVKKGEVVTRIGQIERKAYFLLEGIMESTIVDNAGETKIINFVFPGEFVCAYTSFLQQEPSEIQITAITDCEVEYFLKNDIEAAYNHSILANQFGRHITESFFILKLKRENDFLTKSAEEKYIELIEKRPEVIENIPVKKIAKYLGIHPESLSRIRARIIT